MQPRILNSEVTMKSPEEVLDDRDRLITQLRQQLEKERHNHKMQVLENQNLQGHLEKAFEETQFYKAELGKFQNYRRKLS